MNITVYLGSGFGNDPKLEIAVRALGRWIGESGNGLVYGGSKTGLMGALAESTLQAGGEVTGTLEEISEVISRVALKKLIAPCILYNLDGYYEGLRTLLHHMVEMGLCAPEKLEKVCFASDLAEIKRLLSAM